MGSTCGTVGSQIMKMLFENAKEDAMFSASRQKMIDTFCGSEGMTQKTYRVGGVKIKVLSDPGLNVNSNTLKKYALAKRELVHSVSNNCFQIADSAIDRGFVSGSVAADSGTYNFAHLGNHCVGIDVSRSGACLSVDLTASVNIDRGMGNYDVLVIGARSEDHLLQRMGSLYGGPWKRER
jgi:hypothetical protein